MTEQEHIGVERLEEALDWFLYLNGPARTEEDEKAFSRWVNLSVENREAWTKACRTWEAMAANTPASISSIQPLRHSGIHASVPIRRRGRGLGLGKASGIGIATLAICLIAFIAAPDILTRYKADYMTETAEIRRILLEDGSTVELGASSAIAVKISASERQVRLLSGQAYFDVHPDAARPFTVTTGELDVTVVGTAFDVNVTPEIETVQLAHGAVNLSRSTGTETVEMLAGDTLTLDRTSGRISRATIDVGSIASWRDRRLFVEDIPISAVVSELQRYHPSWITVASVELGNQRVTGLYDLSDPDRALEALVSPYGGKVHHVSPYLRVLGIF